MENLPIAEGVKINLNLHGTQNLEQGVYLYTAEVFSDSQTFVGISKGIREVNLSVAMKFEVDEPITKLEKKNSSETTYEKDTIVSVSTKTDLRTDERVKTSVTDSARQWSETHTYKDDDEPGIQCHAAQKRWR